MNRAKVVQYADLIELSAREVVFGSGALNELRKSLDEADGHIIANLAEVEKVDSFALRALLQARAFAELRNCELIVVSSEMVYEALEVSGLAKKFRFCASTMEALEALRKLCTQ